MLRPHRNDLTKRSWIYGRKYSYIESCIAVKHSFRNYSTSMLIYSWIKTAHKKIGVSRIDRS